MFLDHLPLPEKVAFYERLLQKVPATLYINDLEERRQVFSSGKVLEMMGYTPQEILEDGTAFLEGIIHPEDLQEVMHDSREAYAKDPAFVEYVTYRIKDKQGQWHWFYSIEQAYSFDYRGRVKEVIGFAFDLSSRIRSEESLERLLSENLRLKQQLRLRELTSRQQEVLTELARGYSSKEIAQRLSISHETVRSHTRSLREKLALRNIAEITRFALEAGLI